MERSPVSSLCLFRSKIRDTSLGPDEEVITQAKKILKIYEDIGVANYVGVEIHEDEDGSMKFEPNVVHQQDV
jgi:hypothetical protein